MTTTILITGANGFIGAHYAQRASARGWQVIGTDVSERDLAGCCHAYLPADLSAPGTAERLDALPAPDLILHAGGVSGFMVATDRPAHIVAVNVGGTMTVLELARRRSVRRTILCSTIMAYGPDTRAGEARFEAEYPEPISVYGASKVAAEALMNGHRGQYGTDAIALRFAHVYGPGRTTQCLVRDMLQAIKSDMPCSIPQAGSSLHQYVHVDDVCWAIDLAIAVPAPASRVFNVSAGEIHTLAEVAAIIRREIGPFDVTFDDTADLPNYRVGRLSLDRVRSELGFVPSIPFSDGVRRYWDSAFPREPPV